MFGRGFDVEGGLQEVFGIDSPCGNHVRHFRLSARERSGLVENDRPEAVGVFQALPPFDQDAVFRPEPCPDHDRRRGRESQRAWTGNDENGHEIEEGAAERRIGDPKIPDGERDHGDPEYGGNEDRCDPVRETLDRGLRPLRLLHEPDDLRQRRFGADPRRPECEAPGPVQRRGKNLRPLHFSRRHALSGQHGLVDAGAAGDDHAVRGDLLPGPNDDQIVFHDLIDRNVPLHTLPDDTRGFRLHPHQALDRLGGPSLRPGLQKPAEDNQRHDEGRPVVIDVGHDSGFGEETREKGRKRGIEPGRQRPDGHQRVHVRGLLPGRLDRAAEKPAPDPENDRCGQDEKGYEERLPGNPHQKGEPVPHGTDEDHDTEHDSDGKADPQIPDLLFTGRTDRILPGVVGNPQVVIPLFGDDPADRLDAGPSRNVRHRGPRGRKVDRDVGHARNLPDGVLHTADAGGTAHPPDGDGRFQIPFIRQPRTPLSISFPGSEPDPPASPP